MYVAVILIRVDVQLEKRKNEMDVNDTIAALNRITILPLHS